MNSSTAETADRLAEETPLTREELLALLQDGVEEAARKVSNGRIRDRENEDLRRKQWRALGYLVRCYANVLNDLDRATELEDRIEALEDLAGVR